MKERIWQYLLGMVWIALAVAQAGLGVVQRDLWVAMGWAGLSIMSTMLGAAYFWHDRFTVFQ